MNSKYRLRTSDEISDENLASKLRYKYKLYRELRR